ncbi:MAG: crossover junction endodeoxyribonuclease RuvC [Pseudomonadota bacterium]
MLKIMGIDPGITKTGIAILEYQNRSFNLIKTDTISSSSAMALNKRIFLICNQIQIHINDINLFGIETNFVNLNNKNHASTIKLANLYGALLYKITEYISKYNNAHIIEIQPNKIKKYTTGSGHADKKSIHTFLSKIIKNYQAKNLHESDAIAIAYTTGLILTNKLIS